MYLFYTNITETKAKVTTTYFAEPLPIELQATPHIIIQDLPIEETQLNKQAVLYVNPITSLVYFEYEQKELTNEEMMAKRISDLELALASMMGV